MMLLALLTAVVAAAPLGPPPSYADLAALTLASPVIVRATVAKAERLTPEEAPGLAPGTARMLVHAKVAAALLAPDAVPADLSYLVEIPLDARGKPPKWKDLPVLLFLRPGGQPGQYTLVQARAQLDDVATTETMVRSILAEKRASVPVVTGVTSAFYVPGAVPGEAESQFFLSTADARPISLVVLSRPGQAKTLSLALGDVIDDAAGSVKPATLTWYRLACFLPRALPAGLGEDQRTGLETDWAFVLASLGPCTRTL